MMAFLGFLSFVFLGVSLARGGAALALKSFTAAGFAVREMPHSLRRYTPFSVDRQIDPAARP
jgi:hypothetical protein